MYVVIGLLIGMILLLMFAGGGGSGGDSPQTGGGGCGAGCRTGRGAGRRRIKHCSGWARPMLNVTPMNYFRSPECFT